MKLGDILIRQGAIDTEKLEAALSDQRAFGGRLGRTLVDLGYLTEEKLVVALGEQLGLPPVELDALASDSEALSCLPVDACERYGVFPVKVDRQTSTLWLATAEPDRNNLQEVAQLTQMTIEPMIAPMSAIDRAVRRLYYGERSEKEREPRRTGEAIARIPRDQSMPPFKRPEVSGADVSGPQRPIPLSAQSPDVSGESLPLHLISPAGPRADDPTAELRELLIRLERTVSAQGRAFRSLIELLQEKGIVRRGELGARTSKKPGI